MKIKNFLFIIMMCFFSTLSFSQKITTNIVSLEEDKSSIVFRTDVFEFKETFIIWTSEDGIYMYNIINYTKLEDGLYMINCNNNGKTTSFLVNFNTHVIKVNNNLLFVNSHRL